MLGLPSPLGIQPIRPSILRALETLIQENTILRFIERIAIIPNPIPIDQITPITIAIPFSSPNPNPNPHLQSQTLGPIIAAGDEGPVVQVSAAEEKEEEEKCEAEDADDAGLLQGLG